MRSDLENERSIVIHQHGSEGANTPGSLRNLVFGAEPRDGLGTPMRNRLLKPQASTLPFSHLGAMT